MTGNRLDELAAAWSTDDPDPALRAELEERLRHDPAARRQFLDHCVAEMALVESLASAANATEVKVPLRLHDRRQPHRPTIVSMALWASGLAALLLIGILFIPASDALRVTSGTVVVDGRTISPGGRVALPLTSATVGSDGVELDDHAGTVLRVGPASVFAIATPGKIRLELGQLTVEVDGKRAPPTAVYTDELVANVIGTRFRVARTSAKTEVDVQHGQVRVTTPDHTVRELTVGMRIVADQTGFITPVQPQLPSLRLFYIAEDKTMRILERLDQPIRIPAERLFSLRADVGAQAMALSFRLSSTQNYPKRPRTVEVTRPFDLWGDINQQPTLSTLPAGTHYLTLIFFADHLGEQQIGTRQMTVIAE